MALSTAHPALDWFSAPPVFACQARGHSGPTGLRRARAHPASARSRRGPGIGGRLAFRSGARASSDRSRKTPGACPGASSPAASERWVGSARRKAALRSLVCTAGGELPPAAVANPRHVASGFAESCGRRPPPVFNRDDSGVLTRASIGRPCSYGRRAAPLSRFRRECWRGGAQAGGGRI